jgi:hypothetical protein
MYFGPGQVQKEHLLSKKSPTGLFTMHGGGKTEVWQPLAAGHDEVSAGLKQLTSSDDLQIVPYSPLNHILVSYTKETQVVGKPTQKLHYFHQDMLAPGANIPAYFIH